MFSKDKNCLKKDSIFSRLKKGLIKTREHIGIGLLGLLRGKKIDNDLFEELEEQLLIADVGSKTTNKIINELILYSDNIHNKKTEKLYDKLRENMENILLNVEHQLIIKEKKPFVILMVGVNGAGKTTTAGKLANLYQKEGKSVILAAGDTFRAAAIEQLQLLGNKNNIEVVSQHTGADSASVIFDAIKTAKIKNIDVLIADTAGRLHNKDNLMEELKKIIRVIKKLDTSAPHEVILVIDASTGQNAINQTNAFNNIIQLNGIILTKLDGTAKGGVIFSISNQFGIPIRYISIGENIDDLKQFKAKDFIQALFEKEK